MLPTQTKSSIFEILGGEHMVHVVHCDEKEKVLEKILDGSKTMFIRNAIGKVTPRSQIIEGESLYFMQKGSRKITATASVKSVLNLEDLTEEEITETLAKNQGKLNLSQNQQEKWHKKSMCLVEFSDVTEITPIDFEHENNIDEWLILDGVENIGINTSTSSSYGIGRF